ncbi:MAG: hypothetical protein ACFE8J_16770 [Candidatus Heimdallarchaeota archaeon]
MEKQYAVQRIIKDILTDDTRIQITGYVKEIINDEYIILDDRTGLIRVMIKNPDYSLKKDQLVNVIGELQLNLSGEKEIIAEIIQDMSNLNFEYYMKIYNIKKSL